MQVTHDETHVNVSAGDVWLQGDLEVSERAKGVVLFAHGSGSSRFSSRNRSVASRLRRAGLATLLIDLLTAEEERVDRRTAHLRFDIPLLADRLSGAIEWLHRDVETKNLPIGLFGASTGAAAALIAAARSVDLVKAVVSRGGRPDLAADALRAVRCPVLLIVGGRDHAVIDLNKQAQQELEAETRLEIVPGAGHLFEEAGALEAVAGHAAAFFTRHLAATALTAGIRAASAATSAPGTPAAEAATPAEPRVFRTPPERAQLISDACEAFPDIENANLDGLLDRIDDARIVLIGEASHGTSEFYRMRQRITRELVETKQFDIIAVEADWPDAEHVDEYVRGRPGKPERAWQAFSRFPSWMWRNHEVLHFVEWLQAHNATIADLDRKVGFYGLDLYSLYTSIEEVVNYLERIDPELASTARRRYDCFAPFQSDPGLYGSAVLSNRYRDCEDEAASMLQDLLRGRLEAAGEDGNLRLDAEQNARVVKSAEQYYRAMFYAGPESWNLRDSHMFETLDMLLNRRGPSARAVVWAHNSHVGDARATEMGARGEQNIGSITREAYGSDVYIIGFGTHTGTVAAASNWGGQVHIKRVRPSHEKSYERLCHTSDVPRFFLPLRHAPHPDLRSELGERRLERAIGVIYRPETELQSHYFEAHLPEQFDEYAWFDVSAAVRPLERATAPALPERHPFLLAD